MKLFRAVGLKRAIGKGEEITLKTERILAGSQEVNVSCLIPVIYIYMRLGKAICT